MLNFILLESIFFDQGFSDLKGWVLKGNKDGTVSKCGENTLVGGFNVFGAKAVASKKYNKSPNIDIHSPLIKGSEYKFNCGRLTLGTERPSLSMLMVEEFGNRN